ncbi:MAG TPA: HAD-IA family hydrolase [Pseudomonadales bacterium]|jgi:putative hydrolase of the HAD superfamily|nr:HAD-IA family hydrolase [Pseudomonadales bacterium]MDP6316620.1 HAD-IA family hydrolase [Pseudomonadales bacterium]MDP7315493.1 HAD-IA family hydrolase [Pseudomonadales bacterium]MDP7576811.1 HAD-IA family hydrolase [Pseudomonadales bacterium]HJL62306.1 HAD-IA family hydrolase [Pseudomonadales bacterium]|tara:strand:- start:2039 stop:2683 length:645 start_codon:yes stop_codon:yes gene_type:complete
MYKAVLWDFGGVLTTSPFESFNRFEIERNLPKDFIRSINATNPETNAWAQLESSEISIEEFDDKFAQEAAARGHEVRGQEVLTLLSGQIRPEMVKALEIIKQTLKVGCITNNVKSAGEGPGMANTTERATEVANVMALFDTIIESSKTGIRKPDPKIYEIACEEMGIQPNDAVFLDDLGINLKPARALGMTTIKVLTADQALIELESHLQLTLR